MTEVVHNVVMNRLNDATLPESEQVQAAVSADNAPVPEGRREALSR